ncbi:hypothetical protein Tco_1339548 [Tanacetum coccineum]
MDSILEDSVDENSLDDNLDDTISEMFTDEHALNYSSLPLWDDYDDNLFDLESVNDNTYDDPFDSKKEKIKESKLLIDELDLPGSSDFLPFLECDSISMRIFPRLMLCLQPTTRIRIAQIFEASRARGFVLRSQELHILNFIWESDIQILTINVYL